MSTTLHPGDLVRYKSPTSSLRLKRRVADFLPMPVRGESEGEKMLPVQCGKGVRWLPRRLLRKLPEKPSNPRKP